MNELQKLYRDRILHMIDNYADDYVVVGRENFNNLHSERALDKTRHEDRLTMLRQIEQLVEQGCEIWCEHITGIGDDGVEWPRGAYTCYLVPPGSLSVVQNYHYEYAKEYGITGINAATRVAIEHPEWFEIVWAGTM